MAVINIITIAMFVISCSITSFTVLYMLENDRLNKLVPKSVFVMLFIQISGATIHANNGTDQGKLLTVCGMEQRV